MCEAVTCWLFFIVDFSLLSCSGLSAVCILAGCRASESATTNGIKGTASLFRVGRGDDDDAAEFDDVRARFDLSGCEDLKSMSCPKEA